MDDVDLWCCHYITIAYPWPMRGPRRTRWWCRRPNLSVAVFMDGLETVQQCKCDLLAHYHVDTTLPRFIQLQLKIGFAYECELIFSRTQNNISNYLRRHFGRPSSKAQIKRMDNTIHPKFVLQ